MVSNVRSRLLATGVDIKPLLAELDAHPELWNEFGPRKGMAPHAQMSDIWVRYNDYKNFDPNNIPAFNNEHVPVWYPAWNKLPALKRIIFNLMAAVEGEMIGGVLITRIPPGGKILPHVDLGWHVEYYSKFYLSIKSSPGAVFAFQDEGAPDDTREEVRPSPGEIWYIDNRKRHWVDNDSNEERMTLIMCIRTGLPEFGGYNAG